MKNIYKKYKKNGFCIIDVFKKKDIEQVKTKISLKLNKLLKAKKKKFKNPEKRSGPLAQFHHQRSGDYHRGLALLGKFE